MKKTTIAATLLILLSGYGCEEKSPRRDQIPILKNRVFDLQTAVKYRNRAAVDSLLSVKIISRKQGSDSLLSLVYGPDKAFSFDRFGNYSIVYTNDKARVDCYIMDSTARADRPVTFFFTYEHDLWLLTSFQMGPEEPDTTHSQ